MVAWHLGWVGYEFTGFSGQQVGFDPASNARLASEWVRKSSKLSYA